MTHSLVGLTADTENANAMIDLVMGRYHWPGSNIDFTSMKRPSLTKYFYRQFE